MFDSESPPPYRSQSVLLEPPERIVRCHSAGSSLLRVFRKFPSASSTSATITAATTTTTTTAPSGASRRLTLSSYSESSSNLSNLSSLTVVPCETDENQQRHQHVWSALSSSSSITWHEEHGAFLKTDIWTTRGETNITKLRVCFCWTSQPYWCFSSIKCLKATATLPVNEMLTEIELWLAPLELCDCEIANEEHECGFGVQDRVWVGENERAKERLLVREIKKGVNWSVSWFWVPWAVCLWRLEKDEQIAQKVNKLFIGNIAGLARDCVTVSATRRTEESWYQIWARVWAIEKMSEREKTNVVPSARRCK